MNREASNFLYGFHAFIIWVGSIWQIHHIFTAQSAKDLTPFWIGCLLVAELAALPLACSSPYRLWKICHIVGACLVAVLLGGVILYG